jgi:3-oxosteroid 1-dehydrogenase
MGMEIGAAVANMDMSICLPVIHLPDGEFFEGKPLYQSVTGNLGRPGDMAVNRHGKRCFDEPFFPDAVSAFRAFDTISAKYANVPIYWIMDQNFRNKYAVGPLPAGREMAEWLSRADSIKELAEKLGLPADNLETTVKRFNSFAGEGNDPDFQRGERSFDRWLGDSNIKPNPCLAPLSNPPYYGVEIRLGTVGHRGGLVINPNAQVMSIRGEVIPGLYATSNATAQLSVGVGYSSGVSNGLSMVFGYIAAGHMAREKA